MFGTIMNNKLFVIKNNIAYAVVGLAQKRISIFKNINHKEV